MNGKESSQINEIKKLLKSIGLLEEFNPYPNALNLSLADIRKLNFVELWKYYIKNNCYHFLLVDDSLLYFNTNNKSFLYISNPYYSITFNDFLAQYGLENDAEKYILYEDYEQYLSELNLKEFPLIIRYDYDEKSYNSGSHPVSHLHIGFGNEIRIGTTPILDLESFTYLVMRQLYPEYWRETIKIREKEKRIISNRNKLMSIDNSFYNSLDKLELYLKY